MSAETMRTDPEAGMSLCTERTEGVGPACPDPRAGFTLVELVIAMIILTVGVLGLAGTTAYVVRQVDLSRIRGERAAAVQAAVEYVRSIPYDSVSTSDTTMVHGRYELLWEVTNSRYQKNLAIISTGPGAAVGENGATVIRSSVVDTFNYRVIDP